MGASALGSHRGLRSGEANLLQDEECKPEKTVSQMGTSLGGQSTECLGLQPPTAPLY